MQALEEGEKKGRKKKTSICEKPVVFGGVV